MGFFGLDVVVVVVNDDVVFFVEPTLPLLLTPFLTVVVDGSRLDNVFPFVAFITLDPFVVRLVGLLLDDVTSFVLVLVG